MSPGANDGLNSFLNSAQLRKLARLVLQSRDVVEGNLAGRHRSPSRGQSTEFADHRPYIAGDDLKRLDWKVLGRTERLYIRRYQDETNLRVYLIVDRSASMDYASDPSLPTKFHYACQLAAALGYVVVRGRDAVGWQIFSDKVDASLPPRNSLLELDNALRHLRALGPAGTTSTALALNLVAESIRRRALVIVISDLLDDSGAVAKALAHFRKQHHDVIVFHVLDPRELDLGFKRGGEFEDLETGEKLTVDPRSVADAYRKIFGEFLDGYRKACAEMRIDYRLAVTSEPLDTFARAYLEERKRLSR